jgi:hypothetical protein
MTRRNLVVECVAVLFGSFTLILLMSWGGAAGVPPIEIALATMIGALMIHRLTEAVLKLDLNG